MINGYINYDILFITILFTIFINYITTPDKTILVMSS